MATVVARTDWNESFGSRVAESLDRVFFVGLIIGLALGLVLGYGLETLGAKSSKPQLVAIGSLFQYVGIIVVALIALRWIAYLASPRMAMLLDREVGAYMLSPIAYLVLIGLLVVTTINFWQLVTELHAVRAEVAGEASPVIAFVAYNLWFWLGMLFVIPVITMRLLAEEKRSGTIEVLMTAPVTEVQVVLSKFFAALLFYSLVVSPTTLFLLVLHDAGKFDFEMLPVAATYIGTFTVGAMFVSVGVFFSSLTRNQIIAAILTFAVLMMIFSTFVLDWFSSRLPAGWGEVVKYVAVLRHLGDLGKGVMDLKYILFHLSVTVFMLFVTVKVVEARKWR
jgi:ABC-2 type transport system permease protein